MNRREFLGKASAGLAALALARIAARAHAAEPKRPNILLVIADDLTWKDCEPYGNPDVHTPNLARLAREGLCFDLMFTSTAMCAPSRQQLYTGLYPVRNGAYPNHSHVYPGVRGLPIYLKELGYRVGIAGKQHFGPRESFPFEIVAKSRAGADDVPAIARFINRSKSEPYCLIVASHQPHKPWDKGDPSAYDLARLIVPPYLVDCPETREDLARYYAEITYLDGQVGNCLKVVDDSAQADNTMVIFTSEQGAQFPSQGKWTCYDSGLRATFIVRWPAAVKPNTRTRALAQYVDVLPTLLEAAGADPARVDTGRPDAKGRKGFDGKSFLGVLLGEKTAHRDYVYGVQTTRGIINGSACYPIRSIRSARFKYIWNLNHEATFYNVESTNPQGLFAVWRKLAERDEKAARIVRAYQHRPEEELYDVLNDPFELRNLADDARYAQVKAELRTRLEQWMAEQGDEGIATELKATTRQPRGANWKPYSPPGAKESN